MPETTPTATWSWPRSSQSLTDRSPYPSRPGSMAPRRRTKHSLSIGVTWVLRESSTTIPSSRMLVSKSSTMPMSAITPWFLPMCRLGQGNHSQLKEQERASLWRETRLDRPRDCCRWAWMRCRYHIFNKSIKWRRQPQKCLQIKILWCYLFCKYLFLRRFS